MREPRRLISSGYTTVDVLTNGSLRVAPGGTAANVARATKSLGWDTAIVGTVGDDPAGQFLGEKLESLGIDTHGLGRNRGWTTPVLVQEAHRGDHRWRFRCPVCNARFASHRPPSASQANETVSSIFAPDVFFFDRVSRYTLALARAWSDAGAFVVFEPSTIGVPHLFDEAAGLADLIKFSGQRAGAFASRLKHHAGTMVQTLGAAGAKYRGAGAESWTFVEGNPVSHFVDSAGAGDWTTAGILDRLVEVDRPMSVDRLHQAVIEGQRYGATACSWEGVFPEPMDRFGMPFEDFACPRVISMANA